MQITFIFLLVDETKYFLVHVVAWGIGKQKISVIVASEIVN